MLKLHKEIYDRANPGASLPGRKNGLKPYAKEAYQSATQKLTGRESRFIHSGAPADHDN